MKRFVPFLFLALGLALVGLPLIPRSADSAFDLDGFGRLPVQVNGRIKPLDSVARHSLLLFQGRQRITTSDGRSLSSAEWLLDVLFRPEVADTYRHFEIVNSEALDLFGLKPEDGAGGKRFSYTQLAPNLPELKRQNSLAQQVEPAVRTAFQRAVVNLADRVGVYLQLTYSVASPTSTDFLTDINRFLELLAPGVAAAQAARDGQAHDEAALNALLEATHRFDAMATAAFLRAIPPPSGTADNDRWHSVGESLLDAFKTGQIDANAMVYAGLGFAWRTQQPEHFNTIVRLYRHELDNRFPERLRKTDTEMRFNAAEPFYRSMVVYVLVFVLAGVSWLRWPVPLGRSAFWLMAVAWIVTTLGIATRMWLEGRPPVTNLYSSALFVGWGAVGLCLILEAVYRNAIGSAAGGLAGFCTLLIAHHLSLSGDTLEMMRAVLDSNFWLATHVVAVTLGYASTFLAGFLGIIYIVMGVFTSWLGRAPNAAGALALGAATMSPGLAATAAYVGSKSETNGQMLARMVYGIVCFATLFSLVGTILGGIWADQSWGRFWGWDPKENGALIVVLWNAIILHCRWGGLVRQRGLMILALGGNIVTSWSWFGTNMLGVGLHSYGFMDAAFWWLIGFVVSQLALIALANLPLGKWRSFRHPST